MATIALLGTLDTKGEEYAFVADQIRRRGHQTVAIDTGTLGEPLWQPDVTREEVARAGGSELGSAW